MPLVFPGSTRKKGEPDDPYEKVFRDGKRTVPPYIADLMAGVDTVRYTYSEAIDLVNQRLAADFANRAYDRFVAAHFEDGER